MNVIELYEQLKREVPCAPLQITVNGLEGLEISLYSDFDREDYYELEVSFCDYEGTKDDSKSPMFFSSMESLIAFVKKYGKEVRKCRTNYTELDKAIMKEWERNKDV